MKKNRRDPWYHGTTDGSDPQDGDTQTVEFEPASPEAREMVRQIAAEIRHDPNLVG